MESFNQKRFNALTGLEINFVQDNESMSIKGVVRGLHFQNQPYAQGKLVRVVAGSVKDVAVDIRPESPTFGKHYAAILSSENKRQLYIPPGFAHGFAVLEDRTIFSYKCTNYYNKESEGCLKWNDSTLNIEWGIDNPLISDKDQTQCISWIDFKALV
jgi:dTDP-4-dehydrorhamnose 3,5-epimerase